MIPVIQSFVSDPQGWGYSDIFIYTQAWTIFWGFKSLNVNIFGGFQKKKEYFWGMNILLIFLGVITKLYYFGGLSKHFMVFS